jgi:hypothetical protein
MVETEANVILQRPCFNEIPRFQVARDPAFYLTELPGRLYSIACLIGIASALVMGVFPASLFLIVRGVQLSSTASLV